MAIFMNDPFSEREDEKVEVLFLYNKRFQGIDLKYLFNVLNFYKLNPSEKLRSKLIEVVGSESIFNMIIKEYVEDVEPTTGKINLYSVASNGQEVAALRRGIESIVLKRDEINKVVYEVKNGG